MKCKPYWTDSLGRSCLVDWSTEIRAIPLSNQEKHILERGGLLRVYRNKDGTWSAMPNWMGKDKPYATNYKDYHAVPLDIQTKIGVLLLTDAGSDWLDGVGRRVDDDVFWLEDG